MQVTTKFNVGDEVFTIKDMRIYSFIIKSVNVFCSKSGVKKSYGDDSYSFYEEEDCFKFKEELLNFIQNI